MTLREGRADLHQRLAKAVDHPPASRSEYVKLLAEAVYAVLCCPHDCDYCYQIERKETAMFDPQPETADQPETREAPEPLPPLSPPGRTQEETRG